MSEAKDPAIKLFGKTIPLQETPSGAATCTDNDDLDRDRPCADSVIEDESSNQDVDGKKEMLGAGGQITEAKQEDEAERLSLEESTNPDATSGISENPKTPSVENETAPVKNSKSEEEQSETSASQEKTLKKPDKILPCPRCNSMDTKFCYYNNYNVNQPRHFCKNCQRYWTAGGTMRNVPVGAGRRKNKNSASHYRHIAVSEALQHARIDIPNGVHCSSLGTNGTVLTFGSDSPLCESVASVLNIAEKTTRSSKQNGYQKPEEIKIPVSYIDQENGDVQMSGSSVAASSKNEADKTVSLEPNVQNCQSVPPQVPCFPHAPWPYPWNPAQWSSPVPPHAFCPQGFPMPFYTTAPYWGCAVPGSWNTPWFPQPLPSSNQTAPSSGPNSPTLGKHSREEKTLEPGNSAEDEPNKENNSERCLWIPKTLRIDDPREAAKSSIWATLGIKSDKGDLVSGGGLFKAFHSKTDEKNHKMETSPVLQANPAALSRSLNFQESL